MKPLHCRRVWLSLFILLLVTAVAKANDEDLPLFTLSDFTLQEQPGGLFPGNFFEFLAPDVVSLIEESNGFSLLDNPRLYFEGDPWGQFHWQYGEIPINSLLADGAPAFSLPLLSLCRWQLRGQSPQRPEYGFSFVPQTPERSVTRTYLSAIADDMGDWSALGKVFVQPSHPSERGFALPSERRKSVRNSLLAGLYFRKLPRASLELSASYADIDRQFNDLRQLSATFVEPARTAALHARFVKPLAGGTLALSGVLHGLERGNLYAELGRFPQETYHQDKSAYFLAAEFQNQKWLANIALLGESEELQPNVADFGKDLQDNDGEGLFPFERWGHFSTKRLHLAVQRRFSASLLDRPLTWRFFARTSLWQLRGAERAFSASPIWVDRQPYQVIEWQAGPAYRHGGSDLNLGILVDWRLSSRMVLLGRLHLRRQAIDYVQTQRDLAFLSPGWEAGAQFSLSRRVELLISAGRQPYELLPSIGDFLETQRPAGAIHNWQDDNSDGLFQPGEEGLLFGYTGSAYHAASADLRLPEQERLTLQLGWRVSQHFRFEMKSLYKKILHPFWVKFADEYGFYDDVAGQELYFFQRPFQSYLLSNASFDRDPFYAQLHLRYWGEEAGKWFFSVSFLAHMGMGRSAFGNGPGNDVGVVAESMANPNSWINGFGRLDGDRAFVCKIFYGRAIFRRLFASCSFRYRDGDPFAFIESSYAHDQWIFFYRTIRAEDDHGKKGGPRKDYICDLNMRLAYSFSLFAGTATLELALFNILDFGCELAENVFSGGLRQPLELQLPRSLRLGFAVEW